MFNIVVVECFFLTVIHVWDSRSVQEDYRQYSLVCAKKYQCQSGKVIVYIHITCFVVLGGWTCFFEVVLL